MGSASAKHRRIGVAPAPNGFGAEVTGLDLSQPLPRDTLDEVKRAWAEHAVVWFPDQPLSHAQLKAFTLQLGAFGDDPFIKPMAEHPHILELRREPDEKARNFGAGWHSDWSFQPAPPAGTILHAKVVPPAGGDTLYADCARAYRSLSATMQRLIEGLRAVHSARRPYGREGLYAKETEPRAMRIVTGETAEKTQLHPLVRAHPVTGRKSLFVNPVYTVGIDGMAPEEAAALLKFLFGRMLEESFIHRHRWKPDMLTMWDNRCTMHYAEGGYDGHLRLMHRTTVAGDVPV